MTNLYDVVGHDADDPDRLLLLGGDGRFYASTVEDLSRSASMTETGLDESWELEVPVNDVANGAHEPVSIPQMTKTAIKERTLKMDRTTSQQWNIREGAEVRSSDDEKLGKVISYDGSYLIVEKGFFFPTDYYVPTSAISTVDGDTIYLSATKDVALNSGWDQRGTSAEYETVGTSTSVSDTYNTVGTNRGVETGTTRVPLYEEELTATKRPVERGAVRIEKELVTEDRNITVPVTEERVRVTRVDASDATSPISTAEAFRDEVIEVPVTGEEVDVQKTARLAGEVVVEKEAVQTDKRVGGTVRREEVHVDDSTETVRHDSNS